MRVPFLELKRESKRYAQELQEAICRVLNRGFYVLGPELEAFEKEFAEYIGAPYAIGTASGTDALTLALEATGAVTPGEGDEVLTSAVSAAYTALAIYRAGAIPRFVDLDPQTLQMNPELLEPAIGEKTRAIVPVHLYGYPCDMNKIQALAQRYRLAIVEDACQAHGSRLKGTPLGTFGQAGAFSFYPTKNLGALGDAGAVVTHDREIYHRIRMLRHGGQDRTYHHELLGFNSRLDELQAAILRFKLKILDARNETRRNLAAQYDRAFADLDLQVLPTPSDVVLNRHLYPARTPRREELRNYLRERGIDTLVHYPTSLPDQPALRRFVLPKQEFPAARAVTNDVLSLPLFPELTSAELDYVIQTVRSFY